MKVAFGFLCALIGAGGLASARAEAGNGPDSTPLVLSAMSESGAVDADQLTLLKSYFAEEQLDIELFKKYGLLDDHGLQEMIRQILEVTETKIDGTLTSEQRAAWKEWKNLFANRRPIFPRSHPALKKP